MVEIRKNIQNIIGSNQHYLYIVAKKYLNIYDFQNLTKFSLEIILIMKISRGFTYVVLKKI